MNTFETLGNLIENAADIHRKAAELFQSLGDKVADPRGRMLLEEMVKDESRMEKLLREFSEQAGPGTLNTYMQYTLEEAPEKFIRSLIQPGDNLHLEKISEMGQAIHHYMIDLMDEAAREVGSEIARELIEDLLQLEKAEGRVFTRKADSAYEM